jgi:protein-disulfide isomerase
MKRLVLVASLVLSAFGCGHASEDTSNEAPGEAREALKPAPAKVANNKLPSVAAAAPKGAESPCAAPQDGQECGCGGVQKHENFVEDDTDKIEDVRVGEAPVRGVSNAKSTIILYSDYQCPYCAKVEKTLAELEHQHHGDVRIAFKNSPLAFHTNAKLAAKAAFAAERQGKFWEYHDALFAHQRELDRASLVQYASDLGLDTGRFERDLDDAGINAKVEADMAEARRLNVQGTPTMFVDGRRVTGSQSIEAIEAAMRH